MYDDRRIWGPQINDRGAFRGMIEFDKVMKRGHIGVEVRYGRCVGRRSCFAGILGVNGKTIVSNMSKRNDTHLLGNKWPPPSEALYSD